MISLLIVYCMALNQTMCRELEMVPDDGREIASIGECIRGGAISSMRFSLEGAEWFVKGYRCVEHPNIVQAWRRDRGLQNPP